MTRLLFINGTWVDAVRGKRRTIRDPATGADVGVTALATAEDVPRAVVAALRAQSGWGGTEPDRRARILHRAADLITERVDRIAEILTREQGKPVADSRKEILFGVEVLHYYAEEARRLGGTIRPSVRPDLRSLVTDAPVGVVAAIVPWNYPVDLYVWKIAPALAAGCAMVVKPPPETPLAIAEIVHCLSDAGLPPGVLNDIPGDGPDVGAALAAHPDIRLISATASVPAGQSIMRQAAGNLKRVALELGGQCPLLVLDDADIEEAATAAVRRSFSNMGQICIAVNRILVARPVLDRFRAAMVEATQAIRLGHGMAPGTLYGPVLAEPVRARAAQHIEDALHRGGRLLCGGTIPEQDGLDAGYFFQPAVLDGVPDDALVMTQETFGPVAAIRSFDTIAEAIEVANALPFGLAAYIYGRDLERAWAVADRIEAGGIGINVNDVSELQAPFGGWKMSGFGRELGPEGLATYRETKHVRMRVRPLPL
ncbi:aldehyde dehydrogenase family protein [Gluconacetobacter diazotrophicus]|nr:NAD-dependent succinate-semialdehyde dehydrogenase [Gluconacetobacter diazotrophicus]